MKKKQARKTHFPLSKALDISDEERAAREQLVRTIEAAFKRVRPVKEGISERSPFMWRGFDFVRPYHGRWQDFPSELLWACTEGVYYVPPEGLVFFLPAVLCWYLSLPEDEIPQAIRYGLRNLLDAGAGNSRLRELLGRLTPDQQRAVYAVVKLDAVEGYTTHSVLGASSERNLKRWAVLMDSLTASPSR